MRQGATSPERPQVPTDAVRKDPPEEGEDKTRRVLERVLAELGSTPQEQERALREEQIEAAVTLARAFPNSAQAVWVLATTYYVQGNFGEAARHWEQSLRLNPHRADVYDSLGQIAMLRGEHEKALALFRRAAEEDPTLAGIHLRIARALSQLGRLQEAALELEKDVRGSSKEHASHYLLGEVYLQLGKQEKARQEYETAIAIDPQFKEAWYGLATTCVSLGQQRQAQECFKKFKEIEAENQKAKRHRRKAPDTLKTTCWSVALSHTNVGRVYYRAGYPLNAEALWKRAAELDPENVGSRTDLAMLYHGDGRLRQALDICRQLAQIQPDNPVCHWKVGALYAQLGQFDAAEAVFRRSIDLAPNRSEGYCLLARVYLDAGKDISQAVALAHQAVRLEPSALNYFVLARACERKKDHQGALLAIEKAIELDPDVIPYQRLRLRIQETQ